jgi:hypothetical protein
MAVERLELVFDRFFRTDQSRSWGDGVRACDRTTAGGAAARTDHGGECALEWKCVYPLASGSGYVARFPSVIAARTWVISAGSLSYDYESRS